MQPTKSVRVLGVRCDIYSRIVGYYTPVSNWNLGKKEEFRLRKSVEIGEALGITEEKVQDEL